MRDDLNGYLDFLKEGKARIWMLLIGIDDYTDARLKPLSCAVSDCQKLEDALKIATQDFKASEIRPLYGASGDRPVTKDEVEAELETIVQSVRPRDTLFIYFSGHGEIGSDDQLYLCLSTTQTDNLLETGLGVRHLLSQLKASKASRQVVVMDACHSGGTIGQFGARSRGSAVLERSPQDSPIGDDHDDSPEVNPAIGQKLTENLNQYVSSAGKDFFALLSCEEGQQSWEVSGFGGIFTHYLVEGLKGKAANPEGLIEMDHLYKYVRRNTARSVQEQICPTRPEATQTPVRLTAGSQDIIIGVGSLTRSEEDLFAPPPPNTSLETRFAQQSSRYLNAFSYCYQRQYPSQISEGDRQRLDQLAQDWLLEPPKVKSIENDFIQTVQPRIEKYAAGFKRHVYKGQ